MIWKLMNKVFGFHYVWVKDCYDSHICRVRSLPNDELMGRIVDTRFFITPEGKISGGYWIQDWKPLTFKMPLDSQADDDYAVRVKG